MFELKMLSERGNMAIQRDIRDDPTTSQERHTLNAEKTRQTSSEKSHICKRQARRSQIRDFSALFITCFQQAIYKVSRPFRSSQIASHHTFKHYSHAG